MKLGQDQQNAFNDVQEEIEGIELRLETLIGEERETVEFTDVLSNMENYIPGEEDIPTEFISKANIILTVVTTVGMIVSVLIIAVLGIKYMLGSVEEKADYKKDMIPYLIGAVLTFGITSIVKILQQIGESFN